MPRRACLTTVRFNMLCDIIKPVGAPMPNPDTPLVVNPTGDWEWQQDPDSGAIVKVWIDDVRTPEDESQNNVIETRRIIGVPVLARGVLNTGLQAAGTTEKFDEIYTNIDWIKATFGPKTPITKRDQITNIRSKRTGQILWKEEEMTGYPATLFNVMGVTPSFDPFSNLIEQAVLAQRAEVQGA